MYSYFRRHEVDSNGKGWGVDSKGWQAWLLWGGWEGYEWVAGILGKTTNPAKVGPKRAEAIAAGFKYVALKGNKIVAYADTKAEAQSVGTPEKLPTIPVRYLTGLNKKDKVKRVLEILKERKSPTYKPLASDKGVKTKRSGWAGKFERKYGRPGKNVADVAKLTGIKKSILDEVYRKGLAAWSTGGHRPGASQHAWALARVYSFVLGGPTATGPDRYLAVRAGLLKNPASPDDPPGIAYVKDLAYKLETEKGMDASRAMGLAWSIACKYKRDDIPELDDHCKRPPEDYL